MWMADGEWHEQKLKGHSQRPRDGFMKPTECWPRLVGEHTPGRLLPETKHRHMQTQLFLSNGGLDVFEAKTAYGRGR